MSTTDELVPLLKKLRLSGVLQSLELRMREAVDDSLGFDEFLFRLLSDEVERRDAKQLEQRLRRASFEEPKTVEDFDFHFNPEVPKPKVIELATCNFVSKHQNVVLMGPTGLGKSHIAQAVGHRACRLGFSVLFTSAHDMLRTLRAGHGDGTYERKLLRYSSPDLLIVDDLGLRPLSDKEALDLYDVIRDRYHRGSIVVTTNRDEDELAALFVDPLVGSAAVDRLRHDAHIIELVGETYRGPLSTNQRKQKTPKKEKNA